jgi:hypothetical protein
MGEGRLRLSLRLRGRFRVRLRVRGRLRLRLRLSEVPAGRAGDLQRGESRRIEGGGGQEYQST